VAGLSWQLIEKISGASRPATAYWSAERKELRDVARQHGHAAAKEVVDFIDAHKPTLKFADFFEFSDALEMAGAAGLPEVMRVIALGRRGAPSAALVSSCAKALTKFYGSDDKAEHALRKISERYIRRHRRAADRA
jgi:hypothetical protein